LFERLKRAWRHTTTIFKALASRPQRRLLGQMIVLSRALPRRFDRPLPQMLAELTSPSTSREAWLVLSEDDVRRLADAVAAWHIRSPLGICLRRSLLRYRFLRLRQLPVKIVFGARLKGDGPGRGIGGHAWLKLNGQPYYENPGDYEGFVEMVSFPGDETGSAARRSPEGEIR
jgi:hypothetical protein